MKELRMSSSARSRNTRKVILNFYGCNPISRAILRLGLASIDEINEAYENADRKNLDHYEVLSPLLSQNALALPQGFKKRCRTATLFELSIIHQLPPLNIDKGINFDEINSFVKDNFLTLDICKKYKLFPLPGKEDQLCVAMANPSDEYANDYLERAAKITNLKLKKFVISYQDFNEVLNRLFEPQSIDSPQSTVTPQDRPDANTSRETDPKRLGLSAAVPTQESRPVDLRRDDRVPFAWDDPQSLLDILEKMGIEPGSEPTSSEYGEKAWSEKPAVGKLLDTLLLAALNRKIQQIYLEPREDSLRVCFPQGEFFYNLLNPLPKQVTPLLTAHIKSLLEETSGSSPRLQKRLQGQNLMLYVGFLSSVWGERIHIKVQPQPFEALPLTSLIRAESVRQQLEQVLSSTSGLLLLTSPDADQLTTLLEATLPSVHSRRSIVSFADPEHPFTPELPNLTVVPRQGKGVSFSEGIQSALVQGASVMTASIHDLESAQSLLDASLKGSLVIATLNTAPDAITSVQYLVELGVNPVLLSLSLRGVLTYQRLNRVCPECRIPYHPEANSLERELIESVMGDAVSLPFTLYQANVLTPQEQEERRRGMGLVCGRCGGLGYSGTVGGCEWLLVNGVIAKLIKEKEFERCAQVAVEQGMQTLRSDYAGLLLGGKTDIHEISRRVEL